MEETFQPQQNSSFPSLSPQQAPKRSFFIPVAIFIVVAVVVFFASTRLIGRKILKTQIAKESPTPTVYQFPTDTPTPTVKSQITPSPSASSKSAVNPVDSATGLDRSTLTVEVQNGSGAIGAGSKAAKTLKGFGYDVTSVGNADNFNYTNVTIQVKNSDSQFLPLLEKDLGFSYTVGSTSADLDPGSSADALVIIGQ